MKHLFTNKGSFGAITEPIEKEEILKDDTDIAGELNLLFSNAIKSWNIPENAYITNKVSNNVIDPADRAIENCKTRSSVLIIKDNTCQENRSLFTENYQLK